MQFNKWYSIPKLNYKYKISLRRPFLIRELEIKDRGKLQEVCDKYNLEVQGNWGKTKLSEGYNKLLNGVPRKNINILEFFAL